MRKRHRWIDKRRHRQALGLMSPREMDAMLNVLKTLLPSYCKRIIRGIMGMDRMIFKAWTQFTRRLR
uniref:Uncharacterized protein n=1 Tax=viral metagenome TaxID=1070528 RepID=A0A6M3KRA8_9ZZZZ